jgi:hypothetical protein
MADIDQQIYTLNVVPGIKRDGTIFEAREFTDGVWCRFQRGVPKKMGGYATAFNTFNGISRGISMGSVNGVNYVFSGNANGIDVFETNQYIGFGAGPFPALFNIGYGSFTVTSQTTNSITIANDINYTGLFLAGTPTTFTQTPTSTIYTVASSTYNPVNTQTITVTIASPAVVTYSSGTAPANGTKVVFSTTGALPTGIVAGTTYYVINRTSTTSNIATTAGGTAVITTGAQSGVHTASIGATTVVNYSATIPVSLTAVYLANLVFTPNQDNPRLLWQFDYQYSPQGTALKVLAHPGNNLYDYDNGVPSQVYIANLVPNSNNQWEFTGLADTSGLAPTNLPIAVSGGVCILHPFIFVYGSNGFIANNNVSSIYAERNLSDWNGPLANQVNMASGKIVFGAPMRGGTGSPSGLFWATDSLIRVSFTGNPGNYWQYDIVASNLSIMSSRSVVEMDGVFYWLGVDRFYIYNGVVSVLPNDKNLNWVLDNINFDERQKVWATKVPKFNEIWFFYPRGTETECTDAIIYNVKDKIWYDAGQAEGARRSAGFTTQIFRAPIWAGWDFNITYSAPFNIIATPSGQTAPTSTQFYLAGDQSGRFAPGSYLKLSREDDATIYQVATAPYIFSTSPNVSATKVTVTQAITDTKTVGTSVFSVQGGYSVWQHETGLNKITVNDEAAVYSSFTTCDLSWVGGTPSEDASPGINRRMHLRRLEPDLVQSGDVFMTVLGKKFARAEVESSPVFTISPDTEKVDLRLEYRELRLQFVSNEVDGNYELGRVLLTAELGDERP